MNYDFQMGQDAPVRKLLYKLSPLELKEAY